MDRKISLFVIALSGTRLKKCAQPFTCPFFKVARPRNCCDPCTACAGPKRRGKSRSTRMRCKLFAAAREERRKCSMLWQQVRVSIWFRGPLAPRLQRFLAAVRDFQAGRRRTALSTVISKRMARSLRRHFLPILLGKGLDVKVHGACHCGYIRYEAEVDPETVSICHCTDCQIMTGTAYRTTVQAGAAAFKLLSGAPKTYVKTAESGNRRAHAFCPECGTPVYSAAAQHPQTYGLRIGSIAQRDALPPKKQIWCDSALAWSGNITAVPRHARQPV